MAFYEDRVEHFGGALVLFKRNLSGAVPNAKAHRQPNWYMRLKIGGRKGYVTRSTNTASVTARFAASAAASTYSTQVVFTS